MDTCFTQHYPGKIPSVMNCGECRDSWMLKGPEYVTLECLNPNQDTYTNSLKLR